MSIIGSSRICAMSLLRIKTISMRIRSLAGYAAWEQDWLLTGIYIIPVFHLPDHFGADPYLFCFLKSTSRYFIQFCFICRLLRFHCVGGCWNGNPELMRKWQWQYDALDTWLDLVQTRLDQLFVECKMKVENSSSEELKFLPRNLG